MSWEQLHEVDQQLAALRERVADLEGQLSRKELERWNWEQAAIARALELERLRDQGDTVAEAVLKLIDLKHRVMAFARNRMHGVFHKELEELFEGKR